MAKIDYKALLEDAKRQRAEADAVIAFAERQLGIAKSSNSSTPALVAIGSIPEIQPDTFHGRNIFQAAEKYLSMAGRPARSTEEIAEALGRGGVSATPGSVATILGRDQSGRIQRVKRGLWGLSEWYTTEQQ